MRKVAIAVATTALVVGSLAMGAMGAAPTAKLAATPSTWTWSKIDASGAVTGSLRAAGRWPGIWMVCDANGDGIDAPAVWRAGRFEPSDGPTVSFGNTNFHQAVCGDWDGNGTDTPGLFANGTWYLRNKPGSGPADLTFRYGRAGVGIAAGDWNGDGKDGIAVLTGNQWLLRNTLTSGIAQRTVRFSTAGAPMVGDWDGNRTDQPGVTDGSTLVRSGSTPITAQQSASFVVAGDWNGDRKVDFGTLTQTAPYSLGYEHLGSPYTGKVIGAKPALRLGCDANGNGKDAMAAYDAGVFVFSDGGTVRFGNAGFTQAFCGDWDGNGTDTPGLFANGTWYLRNKPGSGPADLVIRFGFASSSLRAVVGDWNNDGRDGLGLCGVTAGRMLLRNRLTSGPAERSIPAKCPAWGNSVALIGDFNGDGVDGYAYIDWVPEVDDPRVPIFRFHDEAGGVSPLEWGSTGPPLAGDWNGDGRDDLVTFSD